MRSQRYEHRRLQMMSETRVGSTVLDLGYAELPSPYLGPGHTVGFDLNVPVEHAPGYDETIVGDVTEINAILEGRRFDTVLSGELIEHLERPYDHIRSLREHLNPGGVLAISTPNPLAFPVLAWEYRRSTARFYSEEHLYYFTPRWVTKMVERCGFMVRDVRPVGLWHPWGVIPRCPVSLSYQVIYVAEPV